MAHSTLLAACWLVVVTRQLCTRKASFIPNQEHSGSGYENREPGTDTQRPKGLLCDTSSRVAPSLLNILTEHYPMSVICADAKLTHSPWLIAERFTNVGLVCIDLGVVGVYIVQYQIGKI